MSIRVALSHQTRYLYDRTISLGPQQVRLKPAYHARTPILAYGLKVDPSDHFVNWYQDPFGNPIARFVFQKPTKSLEINVEVIADMTVINPFDFFIEEQCDRWPFEYEPASRAQLGPYLVRPPESQLLERWVDRFPDHSDGLVSFLVAVNQQFCDDIQYLVRMEPGVQTPEQTLRLGSGSCRDTAWLMVQAFRRIGLAARFVSGYLIQLAADQKPAGWSRRSGRRLLRSSCLGRSVPTGCRLGRFGSNQWSVRWRGSYSTRLYPVVSRCRADNWRSSTMRSRIRSSNVSSARFRIAASQQTIL